MINNLPTEILTKIIYNNNFTPIELLKLKSLSLFRDIIGDFRGLYKDYSIPEEENIKMNDVCLSNISPDTIQWLYDNNYCFSLGNIKNMINNNRYDIIERGIEYDYFKKILYNRFYLFSTNDMINIDITDHQNPIMIAGVYNRIEILDLLIKNNHENKTGIPMMEISLLDISIKYDNKELLSYLIINYYDKIKEILPSKMKYIINRINNCEDILFYLITSKKLKPTHKMLDYCILKKYNDFFKYIYPKVELKHNTLLMKSCIGNDNIEIFNHLFNDSSMSCEIFTDLLLDHKCSVNFIENIFQNHSKLLDRKKRIIKYLIESNSNSGLIIKLINHGFLYDYTEIKMTVENENTEILRSMMNHFTD